MFTVPEKGDKGIADSLVPPFCCDGRISATFYDLVLYASPCVTRDTKKWIGVLRCEPNIDAFSIACLTIFELAN